MGHYCWFLHGIRRNVGVLPKQYESSFQGCALPEAWAGLVGPRAKARENSRI